ncbi:MAG: 6-phosphofructokinase [Ruminococcaceae bacterium]|nr:6-phosphofructokinase [Oscillospiraceae bacterium]
MKTKFRRIGVLTSGGDAPGMNAALRAVTRAALANGVEVMGILQGYRGLVDDNLIRFGERNVSNIINHGGTILYSDRCDEFKTEEGMRKAIETCHRNKIDGIVAIGGDGTFRGASDLSARGIPTIGIPGTIDNDITSTDHTIGFDTALNTTIDMVDKLRDTCESHARCNVVEIMGRNAGYIALEAGIATGAAAVLISEIAFDEQEIFQRVIASKANGKRNFIVLIAEGVPATLGQKDFAEQFTARFEKATGIETRFVRPAHVLRGGSPSARDRLIASQMGCKAVELLFDGISNAVVCLVDGKIRHTDIGYALRMDNMYKGKLKDGDLNGYDDHQIRQMNEFCERRRSEIRALYEVANKISR